MARIYIYIYNYASAVDFCAYLSSYSIFVLNSKMIC